MDSTARGTIGVLTSLGRLIRLGVLELPALPPTAHSPGLSGGAPVSEFVSTERGETVVAIVAADAAGAGLAIGTANGVVKRVSPDYPQNAAEFDVIALKDGDQVVGAAQLASEDQDLVFITSDAQLLRFGATSVRPQGRAAAGMAGVRLSPRATVIWFGAVPAVAADAEDGTGPVVVTVAGNAGALPGSAAATAKVSPYQEFPPKGRATGGVRCHRFLKGEDVLVLAWAGPGPARGATAAAPRCHCHRRTAAGTARASASASRSPRSGVQPARPASEAGWPPHAALRGAAGWRAARAAMAQRGPRCRRRGPRRRS